MRADNVAEIIGGATIVQLRRNPVGERGWGLVDAGRSRETKKNRWGGKKLMRSGQQRRKSNVTDGRAKGDRGTWDL